MEQGGSWELDENYGYTTEDCVFKTARCFILKHWWSGTPGVNDVFTFNADPTCTTLEIPVIYDGVAVTNNTVNCLVDGNTVITADLFGPHVDYFETGTETDILEDYTLSMFAKVYSDIKTADERFAYHRESGSIHCATNVQRTIPSYNWWDF